MGEAEGEPKKTAIYCHLLFQIYRRQFHIFSLLSLWNPIADASIKYQPCCTQQETLNLQTWELFGRPITFLIQLNVWWKPESVIQLLVLLALEVPKRFLGWTVWCHCFVAVLYHSIAVSFFFQLSCLAGFLLYLSQSSPTYSSNSELFLVLLTCLLVHCFLFWKGIDPLLVHAILWSYHLVKRRFFDRRDQGYVMLVISISYHPARIGSHGRIMLDHG